MISLTTIVITLISLFISIFVILFSSKYVINETQENRKLQKGNIFYNIGIFFKLHKTLYFTFISICILLLILSPGDFYFIIISLIIFIIFSFIFLKIGFFIKGSKKQVEYEDIVFIKESKKISIDYKSIGMIILTYLLYFILLHNVSDNTVISLGIYSFNTIILLYSFPFIMPTMLCIEYFDKRFHLIPDRSIIALLLSFILFLAYSYYIDTILYKYILYILPFIIMCYAMFIMVLGIIEVYLQIKKDTILNYFGYQDPIVLFILSFFTGGIFLLLFIIMNLYNYIYYAIIKKNKKKEAGLFSHFNISLITILLFIILFIK